MVNEKTLQYVFIPLLGLTISGYIVYSEVLNFSFEFGIIFLVSYLLLAFPCFISANNLVQKIKNRQAYSFQSLIVSFISVATISGFITGAGVCSWQLLNMQSIQWSPVLYCSIIAIIFSFLFSMVQELVFLHNEKRLSDKVVDHLESELKDAEINLLKNELDPHFVYNSLMPLYYLVKNDKSTAEQFACKLIQVYQYFLQNRNKDFISLQEEMEFLDNYLFLLRIRYKDSIDISYTGLENIQMQMILPFSLQLLIENAIKHNCFDQEHPLKIRIGSEKNYLTISNHVNFKKDIIYSSGIGLKNLRARYRILCSKNIIVTEQKNHFIVKLPLNQTVKMNDNYNYYRRRSN